MEAVLNELSLFGLAESKEDAKERMIKLILFLRSLNDLNFTKLRLPDQNFFEEKLADDYTVNDWINDNTVKNTYRNIFLGLKAFPYFGELDEEVEADYVFSNYSLNEPSHPKNKHKVSGLADAYLRNTLAVSFPTHELWDKCYISITVEKERDQGKPISETQEVVHASSELCIEGTYFQDWRKNRSRPPLTSRADVDFWFPSNQNYQILDEAKDDLIFWYQQNQMNNLEKIEDFFEEIKITPFTGSGQVEPLKGNYAGWWSRRINHGNRLIYKYESDVIIVLRCRGHYGDK